MKKTILLLLSTLLFVNTSIFGQNFPTNSQNEVEYQKIIELENDSNLNSEIIYGKVKMFIGESFISATDVIKIDDDKNKQIIVKGNIVNHKKGMYPIEFTCKIQFVVYVKENRLKYSLKPLSLKTQMYSFSGKMLNKYEGSITEKPKNGVVISKSNWEEFQKEIEADFINYLNSFEDYLKKDNNF